MIANFNNLDAVEAAIVVLALVEGHSIRSVDGRRTIRASFKLEQHLPRAAARQRAAPECRIG